MKLTKGQAIDYSIELWEWLAETGKHKEDWPERHKYWGKREGRFCPLCDYSEQNDPDGGCAKCPLGNCYARGYGNWEIAGSEKARKKYAKLFLEQLRSLK